MMIDRGAGASSVGVCLCAPLSVPLSYSISLFLPSLLTNAVGLQCTELESWLALAGVAGLHRSTFPTATYGGGGGTRVNTYEKPQRCAPSLLRKQTRIFLTEGYTTLQTL